MDLPEIPIKDEKSILGPRTPLPERSEHFDKSEISPVPLVFDSPFQKRKNLETPSADKRRLSNNQASVRYRLKKQIDQAETVAELKEQISILESAIEENKYKFDDREEDLMQTTNQLKEQVQSLLVEKQQLASENRKLKRPFLLAEDQERRNTQHMQVLMQQQEQAKDRAARARAIEKDYTARYRGLQDKLALLEAAHTAVNNDPSVNARAAYESAFERASEEESVACAGISSADLVRLFDVSSFPSN
eukprot:TRINITY_DN7764_c0_g1_i1.p2 TRINITY_DN7764_c0_g1~~TRINITY_DN7764_c0_g1_i1.p2  ORF type:complete len:248 (+),score=40.95 TRINITY_DN7764_c0_g1_i1:109-852(+)